MKMRTVLRHKPTNARSNAFTYTTDVSPFSHYSLAIIEGERELLHRPFLVMVTTKGYQTCGGTIVAADTVLTAASCLYNMNSRRWFHKRDIVF